MSALTNKLAHFLQNNEDELYKLDILSLDEKKWSMRAYESEIKHIFYIKRPNGMNFIHDDEVKNIAEYNVLSDMLNT